MKIIVIVIVLLIAVGAAFGICYDPLEREFKTHILNGHSASYAHSICADQLYDRGNFRAALHHLDEAVRLKDGQKNAELYLVARGIVFDQLGDFTRAENDFTRAIEINPKYSISFLARGQLRQRLGLLTPGMEDIEKARSLMRDNDFVVSTSLSNNGLLPQFESSDSSH